MIGRLDWGGFSQLVDAGIIDDTGIETEQNGGFTFTSKTLGPHEGEGTLAFVDTPDFKVLIADCAFGEAKTYECLDGGLIRFHFNLDVSLEMRWRDVMIQDIVTHPAGIFVAPGDYVLTDRVPKRRRQRFVTVACRPDWLRDFFGVDAASLHADSDRRFGPFLHQPLAFQPSMREAAGAILARASLQRLNGAFVSLTGQSLVLSALEEVVRGEEGKTDLKPGDIVAIDKARDILEASFTDPPTVERLSRLVGINRTKLHAGFGKVHGVTIGQFVEFLRMRRACQLLTDTEKPVSVVSFEVGYVHTSSFSARFKAHVGCTPSAFRSRSRR